ncbi:MAG: hypothetical protein GX641_01450 [Mollicutes bacterium]|nr:hypothetical protein [Mollicutes bacterium]
MYKKEDLKDKKYIRVMFGTTSGANGFEFKENEVNIAENWNPKEKEPDLMGGFNFSVEDKILRYLVRGDTVCDVTVPKDAEIIDCPSESCPHGIFRANKIIISNIRPMTDEIAMDFYIKSNLPEKSYYKSFAGCAVRGYKNTTTAIIKDRVNKDNINIAIAEFEDFVKPGYYWDKKGDENFVNKVREYLYNIKNKNV